MIRFPDIYGEKAFHFEMERRWPAIPWRTPATITTPMARRIACRYCVGGYGLKAQEIENTPFCFTSVDDFEKHMEEKHPEKETVNVH